MVLLVDVGEAEEWFFALLDRVEAGEEILIARNGVPVVRWILPCAEDERPELPAPPRG